MRMTTTVAIALSMTASAFGMSSALASHDDNFRFESHRHARNDAGVQLGPRPFQLVEGIG